MNRAKEIKGFIHKTKRIGRYTVLEELNQKYLKIALVGLAQRIEHQPLD